MRVFLVFRGTYVGGYGWKPMVLKKIGRTSIQNRIGKMLVIAEARWGTYSGSLNHAFYFCVYLKNP